MSRVASATKRYLQPGERVEKDMPWSEVCMYMGIAGARMLVEVTADGTMAQLYNLDGTPRSFPVTLGEAGIYVDAQGPFVSL